MDYLKEVREKAVAFELEEGKIDTLPEGKERNNAIENSLNMREWLAAQIDEAQLKFMKYLDFSKVL